MSFLWGQSVITQCHQYTIDDGLAHRFVNTIQEDHQGLIWIGTNYGLSVFDGYQFRSYPLRNSATQASNITKIQVADDGRLWLSFNYLNGEAVQVFDPKTEQLQSIEAALNITLPANIKQHYTHQLLGNQEVLFYHGRQQTAYIYNSQLNAFSDSLQFALKADEKIFYLHHNSTKDSLIYCTQHQVNNNFQLVLQLNGHIYKTPHAPSALSVLHLNQDTLWFVEHHPEGDVQHYMPLGQVPQELAFEPNRFFFPSSDNSLNQVYRLKNDPKHLYLQTYNGRLLKKISLDCFESINPSDIQVIYYDRSKGLWFGNFQDVPLGYIKTSPNRFQQYLFNYRSANNNALQSMRGIQLYQDSFLVANTIQDAYKIHLQTGAVEALQLEQNSSGYAFCHAAVIYKDVFWTVNNKQHLIAYDLLQKQQRIIPFEIPYQQANRKFESAALFNDGNQHLWIGSTDGLYWFDWQDSLVRSYQPKVGAAFLELTTILHFHKNSKGLWLCTNKGLMLLNSKDELQLIASSDSLAKHYIPFSNIAHLHEDLVGDFWLATKGGGLIRWNPKTGAYQQFSTQEGLSNNVLYAVYEAPLGQLWLSSDRGLMRFDKENHSIYTFLPRDGITHEEFNTFAHLQVIQPNANQLYFGGLNGITALTPETFQTINELTPPMVLTTIKKRQSESGKFVNQYLEWIQDKQITLSTEQDALLLQFALLDFSNPEQNRYAYRLKGMDKNWIFTAHPIVRLNQLPYGYYELELKAQGSDGHWSTYPEPIPIWVLRPFYAKTWFHIVLVVLFIIALYGLMHWRLKQVEQRKNILEILVAERTAKIEEDKATIEAQAEELQELDRIKSRFFAHISHELRTPLTLILGPISHLLTQKKQWSPQQVEEQLLTMQRNGINLLGLIEEILDLSKLEAQKLELQQETTPVRQFFEHLFSTFQAQFNLQALEAHLELQLSGEEIYASIDRKKIERVFFNYVSNAIKFTPKGGRITCKVEERDTSIYLEVKDTGQGIHHNDLPHIFDRFYQSKYNHSMVQGGTGIGLALVAEFANLMKGSTSVQSDLGKGSTFSFEFPKILAQPQQTTPITLPEEEALVLANLNDIYSIGTNYHLLIVEDNVDMRLFVQNLLKQRYKISLASNGLEALEFLKVKANKVDLIISDVMMPEMDGFTLLKTLKADPSYQTIPIIMLTAIVEEHYKLDALQIGVDDYLTKPFSAPELLARIQNLLYNYHQRQHWQQTEQLATANVTVDFPERTEDIIETPVDKTIEDPNPLSAAEQEWIDSLEQLVYDSMQNTLVDIEQLARISNLSQRQFSRKLKKLTGFSPARFIKEIQLQEARKKLEQGNFISISEVAYTCGFNVPYSFTRLYKQRFGKTPSAYSNR